MFLHDEQMRQETVRSMESVDEIEESAKLYEDGWSIAEIAESKGFPIRSVMVALSGYISVEPKDLEEAAILATAEEKSDRYVKRKVK